MLEAEKWFKEKIKDRIWIQFQARGGHLDGTMTGGDEEAGLYKFPTFGRMDSYELTGAIQPVPAGNAGMDMVEVRPKDFEASAWWRRQDIYKMGPNAVEAMAKTLTMAIRRRRDNIKIDALHLFTAGTATQDIGGANDLPDPIAFEQARAEIAATGADDMDVGGVFCPIPEMWMSQLCLFEEWKNAKFQGTDNLPWSKAMRDKAKTVRGVNYFTMPDEMFRSDDGGTSIITHMWAQSAIGAETPISQELPSITQHHELEGSPWLMKNWLSGCAVGIQREAVKKIRFKKLVELERIPVLTQEAA
jgi:hypothetical protein